MDQTLTNAQIILKVLEPFKTWRTPYANVNYEVLTDPTQQHFQVVVSGWDGQKRVHTMLVHIAIRDNLIWLEEDLTDAEIAEQLIEQGIPRDHIVLGFQAPYKRGLHGFATGET
jgi:XisI protein